MDGQKNEIRDAFLKSRNEAITRCITVMYKSGRKDLAKQIIKSTKIDREQFEKRKTQI